MIKPEKTLKFSLKNPKFVRKFPKNPKNLPSSFARRMGASPGRRGFPKFSMTGGFLADPHLHTSGFGLTSELRTFYSNKIASYNMIIAGRVHITILAGVGNRGRG